ncbi:MAG TPA: FAD-dependent oxidoreductase [Polyangiaceae bacterium]|nr:FAD-dependent oxidoreductase [Polyangiaceae bacterium]
MPTRNHYAWIVSHISEFPCPMPPSLSHAGRRQQVAVVGGGLSGLVVAYRRMQAGDDVILFESSERLGGQIWTDARQGFVVEHGAEGFAPASDAILTLASDLEIPGRIVSQRIHRSYTLNGSGLSPFEPAAPSTVVGLRAPFARRGHGIASFRGGMRDLVRALVTKLRDRVRFRVGEPVWYLAPSGRRWELGTGSLARARVDAVVLATNARTAGALLRRTLGRTELERAPALSSVTVSLAYPRAAIRHELDATGFVVGDSVSPASCQACTFSSSKLPGRSPDGYALLRLFFRPSPADIESMSDRDWIDRAERVLRAAFPVHGGPERAWVDRWPDTLAVVGAEQRESVRAAEERLAGRKILLAGAAFHGPGVEGAVRSGEAAAQALDSATQLLGGVA